MARRQTRPCSTCNHGFTLIETLLVVAILSILAAIS
ncbi:type II secretion system protein [bacterium]|nr:MAG: type II secretion system protein [bacterium]